MHRLVLVLAACAGIACAAPAIAASSSPATVPAFATVQTAATGAPSSLLQEVRYHHHRHHHHHHHHYPHA